MDSQGLQWKNRRQTENLKRVRGFPSLFTPRLPSNVASNFTDLADVRPCHLRYSCGVRLSLQKKLFFPHQPSISLRLSIPISSPPPDPHFRTSRLFTLSPRVCRSRSYPSLNEAVASAISTFLGTMSGGAYYHFTFGEPSDARPPPGKMPLGKTPYPHDQHHSRQRVQHACEPCRRKKSRVSIQNAQD